MREVNAKFLIKLLAGLFFLILVTIYISGVWYFQDKFFWQTRINEVDASYQTPEEVERRLAYEVEKYCLLVRQRGGYEDVIRAEDIEYHYVSAGEVEDIKKSQNAFLWPRMLFGQEVYKFSTSAVYDIGKLHEAVTLLSCLKPEIEEEPKDAELIFNGLTYELKKEQAGRKVQKQKLKEVIREAVESGNTVIDIDQARCYQKPQLTKDDPILQKKYQGLSYYTKARISYSFGSEKEVLDGSIINDWLLIDTQGNVTLNFESIQEYVINLAQKYDTYNRNRYFQTNDGSYVEVPNGTYGWQIDREKEAEAILAILEEGKQVERWPHYIRTAVTRENCDLGESYVEIDLTRQKLWLYKDGTEILESQFVSGDLNKNHATPGGVFALYWKKSPSILKSETPGDSYETPVTYWMPFNGGIGMHDASWRNEFGGDIYKTNGSHGCINLPLWAAKVIYETIETGYPIICYYR